MKARERARGAVAPRPPTPPPRPPPQPPADAAGSAAAGGAAPGATAPPPAVTKAVKKLDILPSLVGGLAQKGGKVGALLSGFEAAVGELLSAVLDNQSGLIQQPAGIFGGERGEGREWVSGTRHG